MKTIGLIGGMSWESTAEYYRIINEEIKSRLGGLHSAKCLINSVDFEEIEGFQSSGDWDSAGEILGMQHIHYKWEAQTLLLFAQIQCIK